MWMGKILAQQTAKTYAHMHGILLYDIRLDISVGTLEGSVQVLALFEISDMVIFGLILPMPM